MRFPKRLIAVLLVIVSLTFSGCNWFSTKKTRPAPVRPMKTPLKTPMPTKKIPGTSSMTEKQLQDQINKVETATKKGDWAVANRETNTLGLDMTRFRPTKSPGKSLREVASFNAIYLKLQANVKTKNKNAVLKDLKDLRDALKKETKSST